MALTQQQKNAVEEIYKKGMTIGEILKTLNIARETIYKYFQEHYPEQIKNDGQQLQNQAQKQPQEQQTPAVSQIQKELVENAPEEGDM
jgi:IS30 family transposase